MLAVGTPPELLDPHGTDRPVVDDPLVEMDLAPGEHALGVGLVLPRGLHR